MEKLKSFDIFRMRTHFGWNGQFFDLARDILNLFVVNDHLNMRAHARSHTPKSNSRKLRFKCLRNQKLDFLKRFGDIIPSTVRQTHRIDKVITFVNLTRARSIIVWCRGNKRVLCELPAGFGVWQCCAFSICRFVWLFVWFFFGRLNQVFSVDYYYPISLCSHNVLRSKQLYRCVHT